MTRTYGTYLYKPSTSGHRNARGMWVLDLEPSVRARVRRVLGRAQTTRGNAITLADTLEVTRDIAWIMERWPLLPANDGSQHWLEQGAKEHAEREQQIAAILDGKIRRTTPTIQPLKTPRDYQQVAVDLLRARGRLLLTDGLGLGKTFTGLLNLTNPDALPALVVAPTHLPRRWETELTDAFPTLTYEIAKTTKPSIRAEIGDLADVTIVSYSKLDGWAGALQNGVRSVIFDEVQELRQGDNTDKGAAAALVSDNATYVLGLTATPIYNYGSEIWNILNIVAPGELGTRDEFIREWGSMGHSNGQTSVGDPGALGSYLRETGLMLGRNRKDVGRELPATVKINQWIQSDTAALKAVQADVRKMAELILADDSTGADRFKASGEIDWKLRQATGIDKAPYVAEFCRLLLQSEDKIVLFGWHRDVYELWLELLADFNPRLYTGSETPKQKAAAEDAFCTPIDPESDDNCRILIMSLRSGAGVDGLQNHSRVAVFGELDWSPQVHEQGIGRLARDGISDEPAVAYFLNSTEGSDPALMEVLGVKRQQSEPLLSKDGALLEQAPIDRGRAKRLAQQILGITPDTDTETEPTP